MTYGCGDDLCVVCAAPRVPYLLHSEFTVTRRSGVVHQAFRSSSRARRSGSRSQASSASVVARGRRLNAAVRAQEPTTGLKGSIAGHQLEAYLIRRGQRHVAGTRAGQPTGEGGPSRAALVARAGLKDPCVQLGLSRAVVADSEYHLAIASLEAHVDPMPAWRTALSSSGCSAWAIRSMSARQAARRRARPLGSRCLGLRLRGDRVDRDAQRRRCIARSRRVVAGCARRVQQRPDDRLHAVGRTRDVVPVRRVAARRCVAVERQFCLGAQPAERRVELVGDLG